MCGIGPRGDTSVVVTMVIGAVPGTSVLDAAGETVVRASGVDRVVVVGATDARSAPGARCPPGWCGLGAAADEAATAATPAAVVAARAATTVAMPNRMRRTRGLVGREARDARMRVTNRSTR